MSRKKSLSFIIPLVIYPFDVLISMGEPDEKVKRDLKKLGVSKADIDLCMLDHIPTTAARTVMFECNRTFIRLKEVPKTPLEQGRLAHEVFHAVTFILDRIGMVMKVMKSDEAYAYLIGYLTEMIYKKIYNL